MPFHGLMNRAVDGLGAAPRPEPPTFDYGEPEVATQNVAYSIEPTFTGKDVTFSVSSGSLPAGLSLNASTGEISGTPTTAGDSTFTVTATNAGGSASQTITISVAAAGDFTNITFTEFSFPHGDDLFSDVAGTSPVNKSLDDQTTRRINPTALVAAWGTYHQASVSPYGRWKNAANGINGYGVLRPGTAIGFRAENYNTGKTFGDVVNADSCVYGLCGRIVANPADTRYLEYFDNPATDSMVTAVLSTGVVRVTMRMASAQTHNLDVTPDGGGLFSIVVWLHDGKIDYWLNGTKQTQITGVNNFNSVATGAFWQPIVNGGSTLSWDLLCKAWAESHAVEADVQALSDHFETLLGG